MATLNVAGGRRSSAPTYSPRAVLATGAVNMPAVDDVVVQQLLQAINAPAVPALQSTQGSSSSGGFSAPQSATPGTAAGMSQVAGLANMLGATANLTQNPDMAAMANALGKTLGVVGLGANLANAQSLSDVGKAVATSPTALSAFGLPGLAASGIAGFATGGPAKAAESMAKGLAYSAFAPLAVVDAALSLAGVTTVADRVMAEVQLSMQAMNPEDVPVTDLSIAENDVAQPDFTDFGFSAAPDGGWQSGAVNGGFEGGGVTVGGPMSSGSLSGTSLGGIGDSDGSDGGGGWSGGGYGFGGGTGGMGD